jgi:hypothetical protein
MEMGRMSRGREREREREKRCCVHTRVKQSTYTNGTAEGLEDGLFNMLAITARNTTHTQPTKRTDLVDNFTTALRVVAYSTLFQTNNKRTKKALTTHNITM